MNLNANPDYVAFLRTIRDCPEDDINRLVLADWLDDNGEPDRAHAIRRGVKKPKRFKFSEGHVACIAYRPATGRDINVLVAGAIHGVAWTTYKGLLESATMTWETWLEKDRLLQDNLFLPEVILTSMNRLQFNAVNRRCRVTGRSTEWFIQDGEDPLAVVLKGEWPDIPIRYPKCVSWLATDPNRPSHNTYINGRSPEIGSIVTLQDGSKGVLLTFDSASGYGAVRPLPKEKT